VAPLGVERRPEGARTAFLLIHGFGAHVDEVGTLGEFLEGHDIASFAVSIAGHGTKPEDLAETSHHDWYTSAKSGLEHVQSWGLDNTFVSGLSMGGLLTLALAARVEEIDAIVPMSPAVEFGGFLGKLVPVIKYFMPYRKVDLTTMPEMYDVMRFKYERDPLASIQELLTLAKEVKHELSNITCPTLILQSELDKTVDPVGAEIVFQKIGSETKRLHLVPRAEHVLTCHPARHQAYPLILDFVDEVVGKTTPES
jgi:carboxylesterase